MIFNPRKSINAPLKAYRNNKLLSIYITAWLLILFKSIILGLAIFSTQAIANTVEMNLPATQISETNIDKLILALKLITWLSYGLFSSFIIGYIVKTAKNEISSQIYIMPSWEGNFIDIFYKGISTIIITCVYLSPLGIILWVEKLNRGNFIITDYLNIFSENLLDEPYKIVFLLYLIILFFIVPLAILCFVEKNNFFHGFNIPKIIVKLTSNTAYYIATYVFSLLFIIISIIISTLLTATCIGVLFIPLLLEFILPITILNMFAQAYKIKLAEYYEEEI